MKLNIIYKNARCAVAECIDGSIFQLGKKYDVYVNGVKTKETDLSLIHIWNALDRFTLEIPAGKLDSPDEPTLDCAARELEEETGYRAESMEFLISVNTTIAFCDEHIDIYLARDLKPSHQHLDEDEVKMCIRDRSIQGWQYVKGRHCVCRCHYHSKQYLRRRNQDAFLR